MSLLSRNSDPHGLLARLQRLQDRVRQLERAPWPTPTPTAAVEEAIAVTPKTLLYVFDWTNVGYPHPGDSPAVLRLDNGSWVLAEQPVLFFHPASGSDGESSRPYQVSRGAGLSTANTLALAAADGTGWAETYEDDSTAYVFHCRDSSGRLWRATLPNSTFICTISRSDAGDGSDWTDVDTIGNFYSLFGMAAHPTDPDVIIIGAYDNDSDEPSLIVTADATAFSKFALPTTDFSFAYNFGGFVGFTSGGRALALYQYADAGGFLHHVTMAHSDTPTTGGSYTEVEVLSPYLNDDGNIYDVRGDIAADDTVSVLSIREKLSNYRPALRIGMSQDGGETWAEVDNNGLEAPDVGPYSFDDYLGIPGGVRYDSDNDVLHVFLHPQGGGTVSFPLAYKATTPLGTPGWSEQTTAIISLTGHVLPAFAYDAVSHA